MVRSAARESKDSARDRRRFSRFTARLPVATLRDDRLKRGQARGQAQCRLLMQDFSLGGLKAESDVALKVSEALTLHLPPHGVHPAVNLTGRVIHCRKLKDRFEVGIEFCQTRPEAAASPWRQVSRLFSMAFQPSAGSPPPVRQVETI
jgi:hypothetical protein